MGRERKKAILALEDGTVFHGISFGAESTQTGEICFNTSMTGYQEILTDPSYRGQIVTMTCPLIGNYGVSKADAESGSVHVRGFVIEELCDIPSNWRSEMPLHEYLVAAGVPGIEGIDTRALTKRLRVAGAMRATLCTDGSLDADAAVAAAQQSESMEGSDFVKEVTTLESYLWDPQGVESRRWTIVNPTLDDPLEETDGQQYHPICDPKYRIVAYDFGIKRNILRSSRVLRWKWSTPGPPLRRFWHGIPTGSSSPMVPAIRRRSITSILRSSSSSARNPFSGSAWGIRFSLTLSAERPSS